MAMKLSEGLPDDIVSQVDRLEVNRHGDQPGSHMVTESINGHVAPGASYRLEADGFLSAVPEDAPTPSAVVNDTPPPNVRISGAWRGGDGSKATDGNILGGVGTLIVNEADVAIPEAPCTAVALGFYGAALLSVGDILSFDTNANMPVTVMEIGSNYTDGFLHLEEKGGGTYLEHHDRPHLHVPLNRESAGHMLYARQDGDSYLISGFRIPHGKAVYSTPHVLHADAYLIGRYTVIYSLTDNFSNVVFRSEDGTLVNASVGYKVT